MHSRSIVAVNKPDYPFKPDQKNIYIQHRAVVAFLEVAGFAGNTPSAQF